MTTYPYLSHLLYHLFYISSLLLTDKKPITYKEREKTSGWTFLPTLSPLGSDKKLTVCSGCHLPIDSQSNFHQCIFHHRGFTINDKSYQPCQVLYHPKCVKVGPPFRTQHFGKGTKGLQFPPCATILPFICELCTVRTHLRREIDPYVPTDNLLLRLERMRMVDAAHAWAPRTLENACRTLRRIDKFFLPVSYLLSIIKCNYHPYNILPLIWQYLCSGVWKTTQHILQLNMVLSLPGTPLGLNVLLYHYILLGHLLSATLISHTKTMTTESCQCCLFLPPTIYSPE